MGNFHAALIIHRNIFAMFWLYYKIIPGLVF